MDVRLIVWGIFGGLGFIFFLLLVDLLRRFNSRSENPSTDSPEAPSQSPTSSFCFAQQNQQLIPILRDFSYQQLQIATNGFAQEALLKEGPCGEKIYAGSLGGTQVVIKCAADDHEKTKNRDAFEQEMQMTAALAAANKKRIVEIVGMCSEQRMLVLKQLPNGDLAAALRRGDDQFKSSDGDSESSSDSSTGSSKPLDWITRFKIATGVAEALVFLHHDCAPPVIHRDLRSSSVLLDEAYEVRLGSLGKACRQGEDAANAVASYDVYCYGKVLLDLISGLDVSGGGCGSFGEAWLSKAMPVMEFGKQEAFVRLVDPMLVIDEDHVKELMLLAVIARSCLDPQQLQHQSMSNILQMLQNPAFFLAVAGQA